MSSHDLCTEFVEVIRVLIKRGFLTREIFQNYVKAKHTFHGLLESAFVEAGWRSDMVPIVEPRIDFSTPFNPVSLHRNFEKMKKRNYFRPDVSFSCDHKSMYFAECCTNDEAIEYLSSGKTPEYDSWKRGWITKRDLLPHFVQYAKLDSGLAFGGLIICITLPRQMKKKPPWPYYSRKGMDVDFLNCFSQEWKKLADDLRRLCATDLIILEEENVHVNNTAHPIECLSSSARGKYPAQPIASCLSI
jgi:hypothetical protein